MLETAQPAAPSEHAYKALASVCGRPGAVRMGSRSRSRSRSRAGARSQLKEARAQCDIAYKSTRATQARRLDDDLVATQRGAFLIRDADNEDAASFRFRCFDPQCPREWTSAPYCVWVHYSCSATECMSYLHSEVARIQCELRQMDADLAARCTSRRDL